MVVFNGMLVASAFVHSFGPLLYCILYYSVGSRRRHILINEYARDGMLVMAVIKSTPLSLLIEHF